MGAPGATFHGKKSSARRALCFGRSEEETISPVVSGGATGKWKRNDSPLAPFAHCPPGEQPSLACSENRQRATRPAQHASARKGCRGDCRSPISRCFQRGRKASQATTGRPGKNDRQMDSTLPARVTERKHGGYFGGCGGRRGYPYLLSETVQDPDRLDAADALRHH